MFRLRYNKGMTHNNHTTNTGDKEMTTAIAELNSQIETAKAQEDWATACDLEFKRNCLTGKHGKASKGTNGVCPRCGTYCDGDCE